MKSLVLKRFAQGRFCDVEVFEDGIGEARAFGTALKAKYPGQLVGFFSAPALICQRTARVAANAMGRAGSPEVLEALGRRGAFVDYMQGTGRHLPEDVDVAVCITNPDVMGRYQLSFGDVNTDTSLREPHSALIINFSHDRWVG